MLLRRTQNLINHSQIILQNFCVCSVSEITSPRASFSTSSGGPKYTKLPKRLQKSEWKPFVTDVNELKRRARLERQMRQEVREVVLWPPENGMVVKRLVPVAYKVYAARNELLNCVSKIVQHISIHSCRNDKILFMINNISASNMDVKAKEFTNVLKEQYSPWFAQYMVMKRASIDPNFHEMYLKFLEKVNSRMMNKEIVKATYENCNVL